MKHPICECCGTRMATDIHHKATRIGEKLNDEADWLAVCRQCHCDIHNNPSQARARGLLQ